MRRALFGIAAALAGCSASEPSATPTAMNAPIDEVAGRVAGAAERCVLIEPSVGFRVADRSTLTYRTGRTIWVNHVQDGCGSFGKWDVLVTEPIGTQHCQGDLVRSIDPVSKIPGPTCRLGEFVPFTKP